MPKHEDDNNEFEKYLYRPVEIQSTKDVSFKKSGEGVILEIKKIKNTSYPSVEVVIFIKVKYSDVGPMLVKDRDRIPTEFLEEEVKLKDSFSTDFLRFFIKWPFETYYTFKLNSTEKFLNIVEQNEKLRSYFKNA